MTVKRIWHGYTAPERADEYEALLRAEVIQGIEAKAIPGFRKIEVLRRPLGDEVEFMTIMEFDDLDSVKALVGEDHEQAYVPDAARAILSRFDERSQHYEVEDVRAYSTVEAAEEASPAEPATDALTSPELAGERFENEPTINAARAMDQGDGTRVSEEPVITDEPEPAASTDLATSVDPDTWFVRKDKGKGTVPVTRDGYKVGARFVFGIFAWAVIAVAMVAAGNLWGPFWLVQAALPVFVLGCLLTALYFSASARKHTDKSITYGNYVNMRKSA